jgi:transposase
MATSHAADMHRPYLNAVGTQLKGAEIVFDKFHVLQHASRRSMKSPPGVLSRGCRDACLRSGQALVLLRRWKTVRGSKRQEMQQLFAANQRLFKAYVLREHLDRLWTYKTREGVARLLFS